MTFSEWKRHTSLANKLLIAAGVLMELAQDKTLVSANGLAKPQLVKLAKQLHKVQNKVRPQP